jgi:glutathione S-transferase
VSELTLYDDELDDQCYKAWLLLGALRRPYRKIAVDVHPGAEQRSTPFLKLNPQATLPILTENDLVLCGAEPILAYIARQYDTTRTWFPDEPETFSRIMQWLAFAIGDLRTASIARANALFECEADTTVVHRASRRAFRLMDDHMIKRELDDAAWFVGATPTIADIALFPAIALSRDFGIDHDEYPALRRWMRRVRKIPGFITMPGIPAFH